MGTPTGPQALWFQEERQRGAPLRASATRDVQSREQDGRGTSNLVKVVTIFKCLLKKFLVRAHTYIFKLIKEAQHTISSHVENN